jgi:hypothetical protein
MLIGKDANQGSFSFLVNHNDSQKLARFMEFTYVKRRFLKRFQLSN